MYEVTEISNKYGLRVKRLFEHYSAAMEYLSSLKTKWKSRTHYYNHLEYSAVLMGPSPIINEYVEA